MSHMEEQNPLVREIMEVAERLDVPFACLDVRPPPRGGVPRNAREVWASSWAAVLRKHGHPARSRGTAVVIGERRLEALLLRDAAWKHKNIDAALAEVLAAQKE